MALTRAVNLRTDAYDVYIGRAGHGQDGYYGNPVVVGKFCSICGDTHVTGSETLPCYTTYLIDRITEDSSFAAHVKMLKGKKLGCFCKPKPCHGDILARAVEVLNEDS